MQSRILRYQRQGRPPRVPYGPLPDGQASIEALSRRSKWRVGGRSCFFDFVHHHQTRRQNSVIISQFLDAQYAILAATKLAVNFDTLRLEEVLKVHHDSTSTRVIPHDRVSQRLARFATPRNGRLALIGDTYFFFVIT